MKSNNILMQTVKIDSFQVVGLAIRTSNATGEAVQDIQQLWHKFLSEGWLAKIPNKVNQDVYAVYTAYEGDHLQPYTMILGCRVSEVNQLPKELISTTIQEGSYAQFIPKGDLNQGIVVKQWYKIWELDLARTYQTDFEVYGAKASNPQDAEVDIFIGVNAQ